MLSAQEASSLLSLLRSCLLNIIILTPITVVLIPACLWSLLEQEEEEEEEEYSLLQVI